MPSYATIATWKHYVSKEISSKLCSLQSFSDTFKLRRKSSKSKSSTGEKGFSYLLVTSEMENCSYLLSKMLLVCDVFSSWSITSHLLKHHDRLHCVVERKMQPCLYYLLDKLRSQRDDKKQSLNISCHFLKLIFCYRI